MVVDILITILLVLLNGFFVAAEFAIVKVRISQLQVRAGASFTARMAESIVSNLDGYLAATQLGITLASLGLGWIGESVVSKIIINTMELFNLQVDEVLAHQIALPIAFATITVLHIVFGELAPKSLAIRHPINTTLAIAAPLRIFHIIFKPFIILLNGFANFILKLIGIKPILEHEGIHSEEELKLIIAESAEGGAIDDSERELIQNVFDFDDRFVWQVLRPRTQISAIEVETPLEEAIDFAMQEGYSRYPLYNDTIDNVLGFVTSKDLLLLSRQKGNNIREIMRPVLYVSSNKKVLQLLRLMQKERAQLAIAVNEFGGTVGLITLEDIIEELVGEIQDEYDTETPIVEKMEENSYKIQTQNPLDDINEYLPEPFPESEEYHTMSGLLQHITDEIPVEGETIKVGNYEITVLKMFQASPELVLAKYLGTVSDGNNSVTGEQ
ncbi:MAG: hemolysin family protein [Saprospiraceae bacterium]|nr:hemolysin family protein [Saprospiraceae bacterium]MCF8251833.1 hemolysin family protein [Saprospiraceae bacterium]MCF8281958.1 hemolysin family protein [Bacteroidales bacterium]MCF8313307.1 hemolysin family protein [Saprospiraceae bacterium]MCF8441737.1 hemolysin family protein [Saprospiraceae bacterium]